MMGLSIEQRVAILEAEVRGLKADKPIGSAAPIDLDSDKYANFKVRKCPKNWIDSGGHDFTGENIADTSPEFCDALSDFLDWTARKDEESNYSYVNKKTGKTIFPARYARIDAARARAWAKRMRDEAAANVPHQTTLGEEIPF